MGASPPPSLRFSHVQPRGHGASETATLRSMCVTPQETSWQFSLFLPSKGVSAKIHTWSSWRAGSEPGTHVPFLMGKEGTTEALLAGKVDRAPCLPEILHRAWSWKFLSAPRSPFHLLIHRFLRNDCKELSLFLDFKFPSKVKIMPCNE